MRTSVSTSFAPSVTRVEAGAVNINQRALPSSETEADVGEVIPTISAKSHGMNSAMTGENSAGSIDAGDDPITVAIAASAQIASARAYPMQLLRKYIGVEMSSRISFAIKA